MRRLLLLCLLATAPAASFAVPVSYDLFYTGASGTPNGTGSAIWDADSHVLSQFTWDFGSGRSGGFTSALFDLPLFDSNHGAFLWEVVSGDDSAFLPYEAGSIGTILTFGFGDSANFSTSPSGPTYSIIDNGLEAEFLGSISLAAPTAVAEPGSLAMFALAMLGLAAIRRRRS